jgi:hypothetical protein
MVQEITKIETLQQIHNIWAQEPANRLRLCQFISKATDGKDMSYITDDELINLLRKEQNGYMEQHNRLVRKKDK